MFLRNAWYVAAPSADIDRSLKPLRVLGENLVLFRTEHGEPVALEDACPHRKLPLSMGRLLGDRVECGYHGLTFDAGGACVHAATQQRIPSGARVHSYATADKWGLTWVWMGEAALADPGRIVHLDHYGEPGWGITGGDALTCACHYLYLMDNLLDPSHVAWVHRTSFAAAGTEDTPLETELLDDGLIVWRWILDRDPPPYYASLVRFSGRCDRLQHYEARYPSIAINKSVYTPAGSGGPGKPFTDQTYVMISYHFMTPIDEHSTRYHWLQQRNTDADDEAITARIRAAARGAFNEDKAILEAVHVGMRDRTTPHINLALDAGAARFRRGLDALLQAEARADGGDDEVG